MVTSVRENLDLASSSSVPVATSTPAVRCVQCLFPSSGILGELVGL